MDNQCYKHVIPSGLRNKEKTPKDSNFYNKIQIFGCTTPSESHNSNNIKIYKYVIPSGLRIKTQKQKKRIRRIQMFIEKNV